MNTVPADDAGDDGARRTSRGTTLLIIMAVLVVGWFIARNMAVRLYSGTQPQFAALFVPRSGPADAQMALDRVVSANGVADEVSRALFHSALRHEPLIAEPFMLAGLDASGANDLDRARRLMEEARRRNPRATIARFWLLDDYLRGGNYAGALEEVGPILALQSQADSAIVALVTALIDVPQARPALVAKLRTNPFWRRDFFAQASASPSLVDQVPALLAAAPYRADARASTSEQRALVQALIKQGRYREAYDRWRDLLPPAYAQRAATVYDGNFEGWPGATPFNWTLRSDRAGSVRSIAASDLPEGHAVEIGYQSDKPAMLAEQLVLLPAGPQHLAFRVRRTGTEGGGDAALSVRAACAAPRRDLARVSLRDLAPEASERVLDFTVPVSCQAVRITFGAEPGTVAGALDAQLTGVRVTPRR